MSDRGPFCDEIGRFYGQRGLASDSSVKHSFEEALEIGRPASFAYVSGVSDGNDTQWRCQHVKGRTA